MLRSVSSIAEIFFRRHSAAMAMTSCNECGQPVARSAESCPHCGAFRRRRTSPVTWLVAALLGIPLAIAIITGVIHMTP